MHKEIKRESLLYSWFSNPIFFIVLWIILLILLALSLIINFYNIIFAVSTLLIFTHVIYGGYFIFRKENRVDENVVLLTAAIYIGLIFYVYFIIHPVLWFVFLAVTFFFAILLHLYYKSVIEQIYLKELCNYKVYVEISGIIFAIFGMLACVFLSAYKYIIALLVLLSIVKFNLTVLRKKNIYKIYYGSPPQFSSTSPLVSIVIIAYNEEKYIGKLLDSIAMQDYPQYEVILVDDHSIDKTVQVAKAHAGKLPLKIVQKDVRGPSISRNYGSSFARGEIILFLDADVILPKGFISCNIKEFSRQKLSIAGVDFVPITDNMIDLLIVGFYRLWLKAGQFSNPRGIGFCLFVLKSLHNKVMFDNGVLMSEDFDYVKRASRLGKFRILNCSLPHVSWRRFHKENRFVLILKYLFFEWYRQNIGEIRTKLIPYDFGK